MFHFLNWSISFKSCKPLNVYYMQQVAYRKIVACRAGSTLDLRSPPCERRYAVCVVCGEVFISYINKPFKVYTEAK